MFTFWETFCFWTKCNVIHFKCCSSFVLQKNVEKFLVYFKLFPSLRQFRNVFFFLKCRMPFLLTHISHLFILLSINRSIYKQNVFINAEIFPVHTWDLELLFYNDPIRAHLGVFLDFVDEFILYKQILCLCAPLKTLYKSNRSNKTMKTKCTHIFVHECICLHCICIYNFQYQCKANAQN